MRIKFLVGIAAEDWAYRPGETAYVEKELAEKFVASGTAVPVPVAATIESPTVKE